jgi:RNA polymerase sigma factor (sigma-70 family)
MDDRQLVGEALAHPASGFAAVYDAYADRIHDYCHSILRSADDAADAAQDTFVLAHQRLGQLREPDKLKAWLYAIARSRCLRRIEARKRQQPVDDMERLTPTAEEASGELETQEARELVWAAAAGLADDDRAVLDAHLRHGLTGPDLADVLGVPTAKANQMLHRMKERLERTIGAIVVLRAGRKDCDELAAIAGDGELTPLTRKRVARHIDRCDVCGDTRRRLTPQLAYAAIPLVPAPAVLRDRVIEQTAAASATGGAEPTLIDESAWRVDGFPDTPARPEPPPMRGPGRAGVGRVLGVAAAVVVVLFAGVGIGRLFADDDPSPVEIAAPSTEATATTDPGQATTSSTPASSPLPPPTEPTGTGEPPTAPTVPGDEVILDVTAPKLGPLSIDCGPTATVRTTVTDDTDPDPTTDLTLDWTSNSGSPLPMTRVGTTSTYEATAQIGESTTTFTVRGTLTDVSGNSAVRQATIDCFFID